MGPKQRKVVARSKHILWSPSSRNSEGAGGYAAGYLKLGKVVSGGDDETVNTEETSDDSTSDICNTTHSGVSNGSWCTMRNCFKISNNKTFSALVSDNNLMIMIQ